MLVRRVVWLLLSVFNPCLAAWIEREGSRLFHQEGAYTIVKTRSLEHELMLLKQLLEHHDEMLENVLKNAAMNELKNAKVTRSKARAQWYKKKLQRMKRKQKRGLANWIGSGIKFFFGNPDASDWNKVKAAIAANVKAEKAEEKSIHRVLASTKTNADGISQLSKISSLINTHVQQTQSELRDFEERHLIMQSIETIIEHKETLLDSIVREIETYEKIVSDAKKGFLSKEMVNETELVNSLKSAPESGLLPVWPDSQLENYYWQRGMARTLVNELDLVTFVDIPLVDRSSLLTLHYSPLNNGEMIATEEDDAFYRFLSKHDLDRCHFLIRVVGFEGTLKEAIVTLKSSCSLVH